jgi:hypothetical protein
LQLHAFLIQSTAAVRLHSSLSAATAIDGFILPLYRVRSKAADT